MDKFWEILDRIIYWLVGIAAAFAALIVYIYKSKVYDLAKSVANERTAWKEAIEIERNARKEAIELEKQERKEAIQAILKAIEISEDNYKKSNETLLQTFKDGIKEERQFRTDVMIKQGEYIEKIFEKLEVLSNDVGQVATQLDESIKSQEKICAIRHQQD